MKKADLLKAAILIGIFATVGMLWYFSQREEAALLECGKAYTALTEGGDPCPAMQMFCKDVPQMNFPLVPLNKTI